MPFALDAIVTLMLALDIPLQYRIFPIYRTPYGLFASVLLLLFGYVGFSLYGRKIFSLARWYMVKTILLVAIIAAVAVLPVVTGIVDRHNVAPALGVHDIILQQEAAMRYLLVGKNPYKETYFGTPMEGWTYDERGLPAVNPALYHFVMPPWYLVSAFPFYFVSNKLIGYFDARIVLLFCLAGLTAMLLAWWKKREIGFYAVPLVLLAPGIIDYFIEGRSDTFALFWLVASLFLLDKKKLFWSSLLFGLALMSKQTIWFAAPFYLLMLWTHVKQAGRFAITLIPMAAVVAALLAPFLVWDAGAYMKSTASFLSGTLPTSYPISGYGLGMILYYTDVVRDLHAYYPFWMWQAGFGIPVMLASLWFIWKKPVMSRFFIGYGATLLVVWYMSRYFNNSHMGYIANLVTLGMLKSWDEQ